MLFDYYLPILFTNVKALSYLLIYNYSLILFISILLDKNSISTPLLSSLLVSSKQSKFTTVILSTTLMSMAGVPPFIGFFSKLFIITTVFVNSLFVIFLSVLFLLLTGLYFYQQNVRYLLSSSTSLRHANERVGVKDHNYLKHSNIETSFALTFVVLSGLFFIEDILFITTWVLL